MLTAMAHIYRVMPGVSGFWLYFPDRGFVGFFAKS